MEEAQHLCDRIAILAAGRIVAEGTSTSLIALAGATTLRFSVVDGLDVGTLSREAGIEFNVQGEVASATLANAQAELLRLLQYVERAASSWSIRGRSTDARRRLSRRHGGPGVRFIRLTLRQAEYDLVAYMRSARTVISAS